MHESGHVLKTYRALQLPGSITINREEDQALVQEEDIGLVTLCEILYVMLMMDTSVFDY